MRCFVRDTRPEWDSKLDMLSMAVAGRSGGEYWVPGSTLGCLVQAADGICDIPRGANVTCAVIHDGMDYAIKERRILRIGLGNIPGCTVNLPGYPLRPEDMCRMPVSVRYDAVVGGRCPSAAYWKDAIEAAALEGKRVAVAVPGNPGVSLDIAKALSANNEVEVIQFPGLPVLSALYRTCRTIVHLGHCSRGYLHSMAMYHTAVEGRRLVERIPGERYTPPSVDDLIQILGR